MNEENVWAGSLKGRSLFQELVINAQKEGNLVLNYA
jgi:hypothetical protein